jgi:hypothetical protein
MSEQYKDPYQRTPINGMFYVNLHGDDALKKAELAAAAAQQSNALPEPPAAVALPTDESIAPAADESSSTVPVKSEASTADAPVVEPVAPS